MSYARSVITIIIMAGRHLIAYWILAVLLMPEFLQSPC